MPNTPEILVLSSHDLRAALPMPDAVAAMRTAFAALARGEAVMPERLHIDVETPPGTALFMPCSLQTRGVMGIKTVTLFPENRGKGLPLLQGIYTLFDATTGSPVAMMDAAALTALRTGAVSGLATDILARPDASTAAVFGAGVQGRTQLAAVRAVRDIARAYVYDPSTEAARCFASEMAELLGIAIQPAASPADAVRDADVICAATVSESPVFDHGDLKSGVHINAVGSYKPHVQEIPAQTVANSLLVVDHRESALSETGDLIIPIESGLITADHIHAELGELVLGNASGRAAPEEITLFKSVGVAVQDLIAAHTAMENARTAGAGQSVAL